VPAGDLVQTFSGRNGSTSTVVPTRVIRRTLFAEMVASAAVVKFGRSGLCKGSRLCLIILVPGGAVTKRASGVSSGILVHQAAESSYCVELKNTLGH
jgi:hypothetical protein